MSALLLRLQRRHSVSSFRRRLLLLHRHFSSSASAPQILLEHLTAPADDVEIKTKDNNNVPLVSVMTLARAAKANAIGSTMLNELKDHLSTLQDSPTRCLILCSCSPKVFSAGADLKERSKMTESQAADFVTDLRRTMHAVSCLPMPVVAAVEGVAVGGGLELALAADLIVASETVTLGLPECSLAIVPGAGGTQRLARRIGAARAKELIWTAKRMDACTAHDYGLVQHVVEHGKAMEKALELAWKIAKNGPVAVRAAKFAIDAGMQAADLDEALEIERQAYARTLPTRDRLEGLAAFKEGRTPEYEGH